MSRFDSLGSKHYNCGNGPVLPEVHHHHHHKPEKKEEDKGCCHKPKKKKEKQKCEGCFCNFAKKVKYESFTRVEIGGIIYTTDFQEWLFLFLQGAGVRLVYEIKLVGGLKKGCCVTFKITPYQLFPFLNGGVAMDNAENIESLQQNLVNGEYIGEAYPLTIDCSKVGQFTTNGYGVM